MRVATGVLCLFLLSACGDEEAPAASDDSKVCPAEGDPECQAGKSDGLGWALEGDDCFKNSNCMGLLFCIPKDYSAFSYAETKISVDAVCSFRNYAYGACDDDHDCVSGKCVKSWGLYKCTS